MTRQISDDESSRTTLSHRLAKAAAVVAASAVVGTRARMGGALVLAGLASWAIASRVRKSLSDDEAEFSPDVPPLPLAESLNPICEPSSPFLEKEPEKKSLEDLRAALIPPPSLFSPPTPIEAAPQVLRASSLWQSPAPHFVEVKENSPPSQSVASGAVLPDTISIPNTPDPPADMLVAAWLPPTPVLRPVAQDGRNPTSKTEHSPETTASQPALPPPPPPAASSEEAEGAKKTRRSFLDWLRE